jgi:hypothetical protein
MGKAVHLDSKAVQPLPERQRQASRRDARRLRPKARIRCGRCPEVAAEDDLGGRVRLARQSAGGLLADALPPLIDDRAVRRRWRYCDGFSANLLKNG